MYFSFKRAVQLDALADRASYERVRAYCNAIKATSIGNRAAASYFTVKAQRWEKIRVRATRIILKDERRKA